MLINCFNGTTSFCDALKNSRAREPSSDNDTYTRPRSRRVSDASLELEPMSDEERQPRDRRSLNNENNLYEVEMRLARGDDSDNGSIASLMVRNAGNDVGGAAGGNMGGASSGGVVTEKGRAVSPAPPSDKEQAPPPSYDSLFI